MYNVIPALRPCYFKHFQRPLYHTMLLAYFCVQAGPTPCAICPCILLLDKATLRAAAPRVPQPLWLCLGTRLGNTSEPHLAFLRWRVGSNGKAQLTRRRGGAQPRRGRHHCEGLPRV